MNTSVLKEIGLTDSEIKVYLALLEIGVSTKSAIVKKAQITSSKVYEIIDKLMDKGLVSYSIINKVKHFKAAQPSMINEYIKEKISTLESKSEEINQMIPLLTQFIATKQNISAEIFEGWKGLSTMYQNMIDTVSKNETDYVFGASKGKDPERTRIFFDKYMDKAFKKKIKIKMIMNENSRKYYESSQVVKKHVEVRFLKQTTPTEINVYSNKVLIVVLSDNPLGIMMTGKEIADSFKEYFEAMWNIAKK
jgi:sugar-specific transcriptional regulator TrmB